MMQPQLDDRVNRYSRLLAIPPLRDLLTYQYLILAGPVHLQQQPAVTDAPGPVKTKRSDRPLNTSLCLGDNWRRIRGREFLGADGSPYGGGPRRAASTPGVETKVTYLVRGQ